MTQREQVKAPPQRPAATTDVTPRPEEKRVPEWRPEIPKLNRSELRRIVIEMIG
jgi:hypothetical protein